MVDRTLFNNFGPRPLRGISPQHFRTIIHKLQDLECGRVFEATEERTGGNPLLLLVRFHHLPQYDA